MNRSMSRIQWAAYIASLFTFNAPARRQRRTDDPAEPRRFLFNIGGVAFAEIAFTRSEARAQLKHKLKLKRLPAGASVRPPRPRKAVAA